MKIQLAQGEHVSIVIEDTERAFKPYVGYGGRYYNPRNSFKSTDNGKTVLEPKLVIEANDLLVDAKKNWIPRNPTGIATSPADMINQLIADSVAQFVAKDVAEAAIPLLDDWIRSTYGELPKRVEVAVGDKVHEVKGVTHEKFETILNLVNADVPVFLTGPAGCGKNVLCKQIAEAIGAEFYFSNAVTQEYKLTGFIDANGRYQDTQFYKAFTGGGLFMLDEIDASTPEVLVILNAAIANRYFDFPTGRVDAHESFRIVAAGNTYGTGADIEYTGRYQLDAASLDRFAVVNIDYSKAIEEAIAQGNKKLLQFVWEFRKAVEKTKIKFIVSYRSIERLNRLEDILERDEALQICLLRSLDDDDRRMIFDNMKNMSGNEYADAMRKLVA